MELYDHAVLHIIPIFRIEIIMSLMLTRIIPADTRRILNLKQVCIGIFALIGFVSMSAWADNSPEGMTVMESNADVEETLSRLSAAIENAGLTIMAVVDHSANAEKVDLELPPTRLVLFGNPAVGTPLMQSSITTAIDLPQKMLIWQDGMGKVKVGFNDPAYLQARHSIGNQDKRIGKISGALNKLASVATGAK